MWHEKITALIITVMAACCLTMSAAEKSDGMKPRWMTSSLPTPQSHGYIFVSAQGRGATLDEARQRALVNLTTKLEHERGLRITSTLGVESNATRSGGRRSGTSTQTYTMQCTERDKQITLTTRVIDEYWECSDGGCTITQLYTVNDQNASGGSYSDRITLTTRYGAAPVFMSLIPGVGQIYKGSTLKGGLIIGGAAICIAGIVTGQVMHNSYVNKRTEYPVHFDFYNKKATDWGNIRNVFAGVGAALYIYNLIDAAVAPGRRQVKVSKNTVSYTLAPSPMTDNFGNIGAGLALNINF